MGNTTSGVSAYKMKLNDENKIGSGQYADVYRVKKKDSKQMYAVKVIKIPLKYIDSLEKLGYDRELQILKETNHPFVIKY